MPIIQKQQAETLLFLGGNMAGRPGIHGGRAPKPSDQAETKKEPEKKSGKKGAK